MPCTPTRSPPPRVPGEAGTALHQPGNPTALHIGKPQHNEVTHRHAAATCYTLLLWKEPLIVEACNFYSMSLCLCTSAILALLPEDIK